MGDFNEIRFNLEKYGGTKRSENQMAEFRDTLDNLKFQDLGFSEPMFTWNNGRENPHRIWERLDRAVANEAWKEK